MNGVHIYKKTENAMAPTGYCQSKQKILLVTEICTSLEKQYQFNSETKSVGGYSKCYYFIHLYNTIAIWRGM